MRTPSPWPQPIAERPWSRPEADAIVSNDSTAAIAVRIADCVPVLLAEETGRAVAAIHAGWRGMAKRAIIAGVGALQTFYGVRPERIIAAVGPAIGPCCYEVSESTYLAFRDAGHHPSILDQWFESRADGKFHLDLWQASRDQLEGAGVMPDNIHVAELCTKTHADALHSYRVHGDEAGRMIGIVRARQMARASAGTSWNSTFRVRRLSFAGRMPARPAQQRGGTK